MIRRVHIVDDDAAVRRALALLMASVPLDVALYASAQEFLDAFPGLDADERYCLVADVRMPGMSGLELQGELKSRDIAIPTILISGHGDVPMAVRAMRNGAVTFLEKPVAEQELIDTVLDVLARPREQLARGRGGLQANRAKLTPRQREVFDLLRQGLRTKEVAKRLAVSPRTVEVHRAKLLERLGAMSFTHLIGRMLDDKEPAD
jgi:FixJ family two-component response regulator